MFRTTHRFLPTLALLGLAVLMAAARPAAADFDLTASFEGLEQFPSARDPYVLCEGQHSQTCRITVRFRNAGSSPSPQARVSVNLFKGTRTTGYAMTFGGSRNLQPLPPLAPGESADLSFVGRSIKPGRYTMSLKYHPALQDADNDNHRPVQTVNFDYQVRHEDRGARRGGGRNGGSPRYDEEAADGFDLQAGFEGLQHFPTDRYPYVVCERRSQTCRLSVRFRNGGSAASAQSRVSVNLFKGTRASGYATTFGGSRNLQPLPALGPGEATELSFAAQRVKPGQYTLRLKYSPALKDSNNDNHQLTEIVNFVYED